MIVAGGTGDVPRCPVDPAREARADRGARDARELRDPREVALELRNQRALAEYDLTPWPLDSAAFSSYAQAQFQREKQMLDEIGFSGVTFVPADDVFKLKQAT